MRRLLWSRNAQDDLRAITHYYEQFDPGLPMRLIERIERSATRLLDFPKLGAAWSDSGVRLWRAKETPYLIFYRPTAEGIRVLKVRHALTDWKPFE